MVESLSPLELPAKKLVCSPPLGSARNRAALDAVTAGWLRCHAMTTANLQPLIDRWRDDPEATYRTWFLWEQRLKNFRSIRRGLEEVVREIADGTFGNQYRGSSLETVVRSIAEQRQIFKGADHAFLWKPKLRIPDIYENRENQVAFGRFLDACACCSNEAGLLQAIRQIDARRIKGLGPAAANLLYFVHPTLAPPFNTAIVKGYNVLTGSSVKLGRWDDYLAMREGMLALNAAHRGRLSNDLGAIAGLLFDVGNGRHTAPPVTHDASSRAAWEATIVRIREQGEATSKHPSTESDGDRSHAEVQGWLRDLGLALGFRVWIAANDRARPFAAGRLGDGCLDDLPMWIVGTPGVDAIRLIDVMWLTTDQQRVAAAFEVEHTTSIYSGIVRLLDLALGMQGGVDIRGLFLVAPDNREEQVRQQLARPAFRRVADLGVRYLSYGDLERHREAMARFGEGLKAIEAIARRV